MSVSTLGVDLAKTSFSIHGVDACGKAQLRKSLNRSKLLYCTANLPPCLIGLEACSGAHYWAREFQKQGHQVRIMAPKYVIPYRTGAKNDGNDADAICEAVSRPRARFVPIKSAEQQAVLAAHRIRKGWVKERTALINQIRGLMAEFGIVVAQGRWSLQRELPRILEDAENELPTIARALLHECYEHLQVLNQRIDDLERCFDIVAEHSETVQRLMTIPGVGAQTATAIVASVGKGQQFDKARDFAAWLGLVPRQYTTGGKPRLGRITKRGDTYLRTLLVHGTRAVLARVADKQDRLSEWSKGVIERRGYKRATVALAAKNARIIWAMLRSGKEYEAFAA